MEQLAKKESLQDVIDREAREKERYEHVLREEGVIDSCEYYEGTHDFRKETFFNLPEDVREYTHILVEILYSPILRDSLEDIHDEKGKRVGGRRAHLKEDLVKKGQEIYNFYASNRLESSNIANTFNLLHFIDARMPLSGPLKAKIEATMDQFTSDSVQLTPDKYSRMRNDEKHAFVTGPVTKLIESALNELLSVKKV